MSAPPETFEALHARHRKEQRDLVSQTTQKKKAASKKTRKGVNEECERLERELRERQARELAALKGEDVEEEPLLVEDERSVHSGEEPNGVEQEVQAPSLAPAQEADSHMAPNGAKKKPNRAKARLARRAAEQEALVAQAKEEAANMPDLREQERMRMAQQLERHKLQLREIRADGHCLFAAVADQMETQGLGLKPRIQPEVMSSDDDAKLPGYKKVRYAAAEFIAQNPDDFVGFMEEPLEQYLHKIRETGEWGGHMELTALAKSYGIKINVLHGDGRVDTIAPEDEETKEIWLGYYKHSHGLGEHYNSLRKAA